MSSLIICGCGWLGNYVARALPPYTLFGTTRSAGKISHLPQVTEIPFALGDDSHPITSLAANATLLLNIPPGRRNTELSDYTQAMCALIDDVLQAGVAHIVFISTTSVYGERSGAVVSETSVTDPATASGYAHVAIENHLRQHAGNHFTICRLAGLVGPDRHPARTLAGKHLSDGQRVVNLVHVHDVVHALLTIFASPPTGQTLHFCSLAHPRRDDYYTFAAQQMNLDAPLFSGQSNNDSGKIIDATHSWKAVGLTPHYASPFDMINR